MLYSATEFEHIYTSCFPASMRLAVSLLHDEDEARDVVHEVFLRFWESGIRVDNPQAFVIRATRNSCINRINSLDTRERICRRMMLEPPPDDFDHEQRGEEVLKAVSELLTGRERQVVDCIYSNGMSYKEAAESLGVSVAAVNKNLVGALKKLRTHFKNRQL